jgi:hypothetical protein
MAVLLSDSGWFRRGRTGRERAEDDICARKAPNRVVRFSDFLNVFSAAAQGGEYAAEPTTFI